MKSFGVFAVGAVLVAVATGSPVAAGLAGAEGRGRPAVWWSEERGPRTLPNGRIVGGEDTSIRRVPHQVSIELDGELYCGGSIIAETWILTAAHCARRPAPSYAVRTGSDHAGNGGSLHQVAEVVVHENYYMTGQGVPVNDIALFRLEDELSLGESTAPIRLYEEAEEAVPGAYSIITGWGRDEDGLLPGQLQTVTVPVVAKDECNEAYATLGGLPSGQICAAYPDGGKDACQGDSGGPMVIEGRLAGIVSWGNGCGIPGYPGVYTEVAHYRAWILEHSGI